MPSSGSAIVATSLINDTSFTTGCSMVYKNSSYAEDQLDNL